MNLDSVLDVSSNQEFGDWLAMNHDRASELWLAFYKKTARKSGPDLAGSIEVALCFGWIDGKIRSLDGDRYVIRFTPRCKRSNWSRANRDTAAKLIREGRMTAAGMAVLPADFSLE